MSNPEFLGNQAILCHDHVLVVIVRKTRAQPVAGLT